MGTVKTAQRQKTIMKMWKESKKGEEESRMTPQFLPAVVLFSKIDQKERQI